MIVAMITGVVTVKVMVTTAIAMMATAEIATATATAETVTVMATVATATVMAIVTATTEAALSVALPSQA
jgi:hypothetical protein